MTMQVAFAPVMSAQSFTFSRECTVPRLTFHLAAGRLAFLNVSFQITDTGLPFRNSLVANLVLRRLGINSRTLQEQNCKSMGEVDLYHLDYIETREKLIVIVRLLLS